MRRLLAAILLPLSAAAAFAYSFNLDPTQTGALLIGTSTTAPTRVFTNDSAASKTCVVNTSTNTVFFVGYSTSSALGVGASGTMSISTSTGSFSLPGTSANLVAEPFCFDGPRDAYRGPLWAVSATGGNVIQRLRTH